MTRKNLIGIKGKNFEIQKKVKEIIIGENVDMKVVGMVKKIKGLVEKG